jgi:endonuclease G, mitochondrial
MKISYPIAAALTAATLAVTAGSSELHSFHCLGSCPTGAADTNDIVVREIYTLSSNDITRVADWVAYRITPDSIGPSESRLWAADPTLEADETLTPGDYRGAPRVLHIDRGHQAPLASFAGTPHAADTNFLSNITPQSSALNQGAWVHLENAERSLVRSTAGPVYVITGTLFERLMRPLPNGPQMHRVPSGYWKVVATLDGRATAFIMDQSLPRDAAYCDHRVPLQEIELRARLNLFPSNDSVGDEFLDVELGCAELRPERPLPEEIPE